MADTDPELPPRPATSPEPDEDEENGEQDRSSLRDILAAGMVISVGRNGDELVFSPEPSQAGVWPAHSDPPGDDRLVLVIFLAVDESVQGPRITPTVIVVGPSWVMQRPDYATRVEDGANRLVGEMNKRVVKDIATQAIQPEWNRITLHWAPTPDFGRFNSAAELARNLETWEHGEAGRWLAQVGSAAGMPSGVAGARIAVVAVVPLPGDQTLGRLSIVLNLAGVAFALATGNPVLACASLKSFAHEALIKAVSVEIRAILAPRVEPSPDIKLLAKEILSENQPEPNNQGTPGQPDPDHNHGPQQSSGPGPSF
jgi:hypothetical protein